MYPKSEILFPHRAIRPLGPERGADWQELVNQVASQRDGNEDTLAFSLMMIRLCDCLNCDQSSYKASLWLCNLRTARRRRRKGLRSGAAPNLRADAPGDQTTVGHQAELTSRTPPGSAGATPFLVQGIRPPGTRNHKGASRVARAQSPLSSVSCSRLLSQVRPKDDSPAIRSTQSHLLVQLPLKSLSVLAAPTPTLLPAASPHLRPSELRHRCATPVPCRWVESEANCYWSV